MTRIVFAAALAAAIAPGWSMALAGAEIIAASETVAKATPVAVHGTPATLEKAEGQLRVLVAERDGTSGNATPWPQIRDTATNVRSSARDSETKAAAASSEGQGSFKTAFGDMRRHECSDCH